MKKLLTIYSIVFLCAGNLIFSHVHHAHENGDSHHEIDHRCIDCLTLESNQYEPNNINIIFLDICNIPYILETQISIICFDFNSIPARSPPYLF